MNSRNQSQLDSFVQYCANHPQERFWQALRNWAELAFVLSASGLNLHTNEFEGLEDTFYWEDKNN